MEAAQNARTTKSMIAAAREKMVNELKPGMMVAILLNVGVGRDYEPWLLDRLCGPARPVLAGDVAEAAELSVKISLGQQVIELQKYEAALRTWQPRVCRVQHSRHCTVIIALSPRHHVGLPGEGCDSLLKAPPNKVHAIHRRGLQAVREGLSGNHRVQR
eukprot:1724525-Pleurochrysis_carterae.AAC.1